MVISVYSLLWLLWLINAGFVFISSSVVAATYMGSFLNWSQAPTLRTTHIDHHSGIMCFTCFVYVAKEVFNIGPPDCQYTELLHLRDHVLGQETDQSLYIRSQVQHPRSVYCTTPLLYPEILTVFLKYFRSCAII